MPLKVPIFLLSRLIISFEMLSCSVGEMKLSLIEIFLLIRFILGCCSNFLIAI